MVQRSQTVYLVLAFLCMALLLFFPFFSVTSLYEGISATGEVSAYGFAIIEAPTIDLEGMTLTISEPVSMPIYIIVIILALISAACIMSYKNRKRQLALCRLNFLLHLIVVIAFYTFYYLGQDFLKEALTAQAEGVEISFSMQMGFYLLIPTIPFLLLAIRGIKNDEKLLASIDRIR